MAQEETDPSGASAKKDPMYRIPKAVRAGAAGFVIIASGTGLGIWASGEIFGSGNDGQTQKTDILAGDLQLLEISPGESNDALRAIAYTQF